ncbi:MAG: hypothetical protein IJ597_04640, partial [Synergistaceae bacterium]|nr:hypothetical protein [Synergistaceae bacterium]
SKDVFSRRVNGAAAVAGTKISLADAEDEEAAFFLDENGNPTSVVSGDASEMTVVAHLTGGKTYDSAFITVDASAADKAAIAKIVEDTADSTPNSQNNDQNDDSENEDKSSSNVSGSSAGCEMGFGLWSLAALAAFMKLSKKR